MWRPGWVVVLHRCQHTRGQVTLSSELTGQKWIKFSSPLTFMNLRAENLNAFSDTSTFIVKIRRWFIYVPFLYFLIYSKQSILLTEACGVQQINWREINGPTSVIQGWSLFPDLKVTCSHVDLLFWRDSAASMIGWNCSTSHDTRKHPLRNSADWRKLSF